MSMSQVVHLTVGVLLGAPLTVPARTQNGPKSLLGGPPPNTIRMRVPDGSKPCLGRRFAHLTFAPHIGRHEVPRKPHQQADHDDVVQLAQERSERLVFRRRFCPRHGERARRHPTRHTAFRADERVAAEGAEHVHRGSGGDGLSGWGRNRRFGA